MNYLMLRGSYPTDRENPAEILYSSLESETDMYTHLWNAVLDEKDRGTVLYYGHNYHAQYHPNFDVRMVKDLADYKTADIPHVIFCRGNCPEYNKVLNRWPCAKRVYYGAGRHYVPPSRNYDMVLVDSEEQKRKIEKGMHIRTALFCKPSAPHFRLIDCEKQYDCCFVAIHPKDPRKQVQWVYETVPKGMTILQIGNPPKRHPKNVHVVKARSEMMPKLMAMCRVGILPSTEDDSGPRVVPEFIACGLPVVASVEVRLWDDMYHPIRAPRLYFWDTVKQVIKDHLDEKAREATPITVRTAAIRLRWAMEELK